MIRLLILTFIFSGLAGLISIANGQLNPDNLTHYSETDGNTINDVISDQYGFIWLATSNGLIRFDGYEFTRYYNDPNDSTSISQILIHSLLEDSKGRIWIGSVSDINVYDPATGSFRSFPFENMVGLREGELPIITTITENANGTIYFGIQSYYGIPIYDQVILYYNELTDSVHKASESIFENMYGISSSTSDLNGISWFAGPGSIVRIDIDGNAKNITLPSIYSEVGRQNPVIHSDDGGMTWMSFEPSVLHKYNPQTETYEEFRLSNFTGTAYDEVIILSIRSDSQNRIWLATDKGLFLFDEILSLLSGFSEDNDNTLQESVVTSLDFDSFGNIWIGTYSNGLLKYEEKSYYRSVRSSRNNASEITPGWVTTFLESGDSSVWLSTSGFGSESGLNKIDLQTGSFYKYPYSELFENLFDIRDIDPLSDKSFLLSTFEGLFNLDTETMSFEAIETPGIPDSLVLINNYHKDRVGTEWIGTPFGLFEKRNGQSEFAHHDLSNFKNGSIISNEVVHIVESNRNGIWFLTNFGLFSADPETGEMFRHGYDQNAGDVFISQDMNFILDDENGTVWIGTWQGGLSRYRLETGEIKNYTRSDGLPSMGIQYILHDPEQDDLWLSTFEGISRFNIPTEEFVNYTTDDGIHSQLFADGSGLKSKTGQFFFGGSGGYTFFRPENIIQSSIPPVVSLTGINVSNQKMDFENGIQQTDRIELKHNENTLSIGFAAIHYSNPDRNKVRYILKNYDSGWHESGNQRFAYYSGIPPGTYNFEVNAANSNGIWNTDAATIEIQILPPWWRTWIAYGFYVILLIGGLFSVYQNQRNRLVHKERERAREKELVQAKEIEIAYNNLEVAHENLKAAQDQLVQQEKLASLGQLTAGIAHEIKNPLNFVNNFSDLSIELVEEARDEVKASMRSPLEGGKSGEADLGDDNGSESEVDSTTPNTPLNPLSRGEADSSPDKTLILDILDNIEMNLKKIHEHGTRADGIVKSMLQHSRGGDGKPEPTDLNALVKEYVNLSFHGMRASNDPINVDIEIDLDENIGEVEMIAEDFSRVILNLCNNAFDALREKNLSPNPSPLGRGVPEGRGEGEYSPKLTVRTKKSEDSITIEIEDNGPGIPDDIKDKILQPFFTTKKGTQGTGLGLSITNDIVKAHGGRLGVATDEQGTTFSIILNS